MDLKRTHVVYYEKSLLIQHDPDLGQETLEIAQESVRQAAMEADILGHAADYGRIYFENFLRSLGFTEVEVIVD
jgi:hypothetical protein